MSLNVGRPAPNPWKGLPATGIDKRPVHGPVAVIAPVAKGDGAVGLAGDRAYDVKHHGGTDQALYAYAREDLDTWERLLGRPLENGSSFGENLTTVGLDVNGALVGERWRIGRDVLLEVTGPRIPCATFQGWLGEPDWLTRFLGARQPGAYLRVLDGGEICADDPIEVVHRPQHAVTVALAFRASPWSPSCCLSSLSPRPCRRRPRRSSGGAVRESTRRPSATRRILAERCRRPRGRG